MIDLRRFCPSGTSSSRLLEWSPLSGRLVGTSRCQGPPLSRGGGGPVIRGTHFVHQIRKLGSENTIQITFVKEQNFPAISSKLWDIRRMPRYIFSSKKNFCDLLIFL